MTNLLLDLVGIDQVEDYVGNTYGNPHFRESLRGSQVCALVFSIRPDGLVYCGDCGAQIGKIAESWNNSVRPLWLRRTAMRFEIGSHRDLFPEQYEEKRQL